MTFELSGRAIVELQQAGSSLAQGAELGEIVHKRLVLSPLMDHGQVHVYRAHCQAGERVRVQLMTPSLPTGRGIAPAIGLVARSLPYSADVDRLPLNIPSGYSAVVAPAPGQLHTPLRDSVSRAQYYPGPVIDTRTLVSGVCYIVVWSPQHLMGEYMLSIGHRWSRSWLYWAGLPMYWWRLRGWYGLSRIAAYLMALVLVFILWISLMRRRRDR